MHQPWYRDGIDGDYFLPWVYLHAIKDYSDMAWHLENNPDMRVVVNFSPVLLEQIEDYRQQLDALINRSHVSAEPLLNWLSGIEHIPEDAISRQNLVKACRRANAATMIEPYPEFVNLLQIIDQVDNKLGNDGLLLLNEEFFLNLLMRYHLSWCGAELREKEIIHTLIEHRGTYTAEHRFSLLKTILECLESIIPRYRTLAERGQIELSISPYSHPIIPLLSNFNNTECSHPEITLPQSGNYPDGITRSKWQIEEAIKVFQNFFGFKPRGIWSSEGSISDDAIALFDQYDLMWTASGQGVWHKSCEKNGCDPQKIADKKLLFASYKVDGYRPKLFFRDDGMSDLIGFEYSKRDPVEAAHEFSSIVKSIAAFIGEDCEKGIVSIILDGENAWEYFPDNAKTFLNQLYQALTNEDSITLRTFSECAHSLPSYEIKTLCAGSWVYGNFSTWIGKEEKNNAWDLLNEAKRHYDDFIGSGVTDDQIDTATRQLAICESSDWFWWFGDYNPGESIEIFDQLFRQQLKQLYRIMQKNPPEILNLAINKHLDSTNFIENAGTMRRGEN